MTVSLPLAKKPVEIVALKPPASPASLAHKDFPEFPDYRRIPSYADVTEEQFLDHKWQAKKSITRPDKLLEALKGLVSEDFIKDATAGFAGAPMSVRVSPYLLSLIDWERPYEDPLRTQFIPLASRMLPDHPKLGLDSLHEREDAPVPGLTH
ncbi:MAG TPA: KamA family radical SAM protein, partial [Byssovorax sp.]